MWPERHHPVGDFPQSGKSRLVVAPDSVQFRQDGAAQATYIFGSGKMGVETAARNRPGSSWTVHLSRRSGSTFSFHMNSEDNLEPYLKDAGELDFYL